MKKLLILLLVLPFLGFSQESESKFKKELKKTFKFSTIFAAVNGGTSLADKNEFSVNTGALIQDVIETPFDYSLSLGIRKIARFQYENRANVLKLITEEYKGRHI